MKKRMIYTIAVLSGSLALLASPASAQTRVSTGLHVSAGSCSGCDLSDKSMTGMTMRDADFSHSLFNRSNLSGGRFYRSNLSETHFKKAFLARVKAVGVNFSHAELQDATLTEASLNNTILEEANLRRADLARGQFILSNFKNANLESASAPGANFQGSIFTGARFDHANLNGATLDQAVFTNVKFGNAVFDDATMINANLSGANLSQVQGLTQVQLDTACGDWGTQLPDGLTVSYCTQTLEAQNMGHHPAQHAKLNKQQKKAAKRLDRAVSDIELLLTDMPETEQLRRDLQKIHSELVSARRAIED